MRYGLPVCQNSTSFGLMSQREHLLSLEHIINGDIVSNGFLEGLETRIFGLL
jgi:hypothetical protein